MSVFADVRITSAASSTSNKVKLDPPVTLMIASVAPPILVSKRGLDTACKAASLARSSPAPIPIQIGRAHV